MSGIAGILRLDDAAVQPAAIEAMLSVLSRRGPDRQGSHVQASLAMGQALLATTPEALVEQQPWQHPDDGCLVVSDSRLDNRPELLRELGIAHQHADEIGDARLLHAAWRRWGEDCADRLLGDFAFAIWDPRRKSLFCARDIAGIRPFHFHHLPGKLFAFASEAEALLALPCIPRQLDDVRMLDALLPQLQGLDDSNGVYRHIKRLPPAHVLVMAAGQLRSREYWTPFSRPRHDLPVTDQGWIDGLRMHLEEAVRCRLRSNVPVGSMLSGGLDSSSLVAIASGQLAEQGRGRLHTFSAVSAEPDCPETAAIRQMLAAFDLQAQCLDWRKIPDMLDQVAQDWSRMAEPSDAMMVMVDCQYRAASGRGVKVVFDGNNADALLYEGHYLADLLGHGRWPTAIREASGQARFYREGWQSWGYLRPELIHAFVPAWFRAALRRIRQPALLRRRIAAALVTAEFAKESGLAATLQDLSARPSRPVATSDDGLGQSWTMSCHTIAGMERYGRLASAQGVETRHPFMDRRLIEFCAWIPPRLRLREGWPKWVLRQAMDRYLPAGLAWRRGKEHLGWRFNFALYQRLGRFHPMLGLAESTQDPMIVDVAAFPLATRPLATSEDRPSHESPEDWEARLAASALVVWLARNRC